LVQQFPELLYARRRQLAFLLLLPFLTLDSSSLLFITVQLEIPEENIRRVLEADTLCAVLRPLALLVHIALIPGPLSTL
jgi:hypothetical protein